MRTLNPFCSKCGKRKTRKNTYMRSSGIFAAYCKTCDKKISTRAMVLKQAKAGGGKRWLRRKIAQTTATLSLYEQILAGWKP